MIYQSLLLDGISEQLKKNDPFITRSNWVKTSREEYKHKLDFFTHHISQVLTLGDVFAVWIENEILFSQITLSGLRSWGTACLLDPETWETIIKNQILQAKVQYIFIEWKIFDLFFLTRNSLLQLPVEYILLWSSIFGFRKSQIPCDGPMEILSSPERLHEDQSAIIVFTWWTTNIPKWVVHSHKSLLITAEKFLLLLSPVKLMYVDMPHFLLFGILLGMHMVTGKNRYSSRKIFSIIEKFNVDGYFSPPYRYNFLIEKWYVPESLKYIYLWSAPVYYGFLSRLVPLLNPKQNIYCIYGMTEILPISIIDGREKLQFWNVSWDILWRVYDDIEVINDKNEFLVKWPHKAEKYIWNSPEEYISTGDCWYISEGILVMTWRKKDMIIRKDFNIYPSLYESVISMIPWVVEVALVGIFDEVISDERVYLFLEVSWIEYRKEDIFSLLKKWRYSIDQFALPDEIHFMILPRKWRQRKVDKDGIRLYIQKNLLWK